ncbi:MAG TPA: ATP-binding protein [Polyangiaceae bacterium]|nr:ATP-binding protein [Polyangiaceae bacterium]
MAIAWGEARAQLYNDAFAAFCGDKHPHSLGLDMKECWATAWPLLGPCFEQARCGEGTYIEDGRLYVDRGGLLQETFATLSFSPVREPGQATPGGVLLTILETTRRVIGERRASLLRDVVAAGSGATSAREALVVSLQALDAATSDVPFALIYGVDPQGHEAQLVARTRSAPDVCSPSRLDLRDARTNATSWPVIDVVTSSRSSVLDEIGSRFGAFACEPYPEPPSRALLLPVTLPRTASPCAVLVAAQSARLALDDDYLMFFERVAAAIATSVAGAQAHEAQRRRAEQLTALDHAKTTFFSNVSHEFRTPLTLVAGPLEDELSERDQPLPEPRRERLVTAHRNTVRLLKLVNTLLDFSRLEAGRALARYRPTQLGTLTSELSSLFRSAIERAGLTLAVEIEPLPSAVFVDRDMWEKIVLNLMSNAFKHTFEGGIRVRLRASATVIELSVADTGIGIAQRDLPRLFERFERVVGARSRSHEGTGIGLALVRELANPHGGDARVESVEGLGTTFTVTVALGSDHLPAEHVDLDASAQPSGGDVAAYVQEALRWSPARRVEHFEVPAELSASAGAHHPKVLLAEDNADMRAYIARLLQNASYHVAAVADGQSAVELLPSFQPDLVLADVMMPGLDGTGLVRALREDPRTRRLPVILLSANASEDAAIEGIEAGADDYLAKPLSGRELLARVRTHVDLARARREHAEHLERTNQELEAFSYSVSHDLRTPLRAIDGFSKAVLTRKSEQLDEEGKQYLERVRRAAGRMSELIDELLNLSRVSRAPLNRQTISLTDLAERVARDLADLEPERHVSFRAEPGLTAHADRRLLQIVLENMLENSWKFTKLRGDAQIVVGRRQGALPATFFVTDNGAGFDQTYAQRLFQPFQRLHLERDFPGTGIGLAIVHRIVSRHGGRVWAEGREQQGATFYFTLPEAT